jgi:hypothetical protein
MHAASLPADIKLLPASEVACLADATLESTATALERAETLWGPSKRIQQFRNLLAQRGDTIYDYRIEDHFTASAIVLHAQTQRILMTFHPWYKLWLQLGGHDKVKTPLHNPLAIAAMEAQEESGMQDLLVCDWPVRVDPHEAFACKSAPGATHNHHYDIAYMAVANTETFTMSDESEQMAWFSLDELKELADKGAAQQRAVDMASNALWLYAQL